MAEEGNQCDTSGSADVMAAAAAVSVGVEAFVVIAGFGVPGRVLAESLKRQGIRYSVIDSNPQTAERCGAGEPIVTGDARRPEVLKAAGIDKATLFAATVPDENVVLQTVEEARRLNPSVRIVARCHYTSTGMRARQRGASDVVVSEQEVAKELNRLVSGLFEKP
jgi:CPA2 family monovalent cation:H+ antiporter-2